MSQWNQSRFYSKNSLNWKTLKILMKEWILMNMWTWSYTPCEYSVAKHWFYMLITKALAVSTSTSNQLDSVNIHCFSASAQGFRCYAKFHRKRRVTRRRGRCVVPESVSSDQGGFITIWWKEGGQRWRSWKEEGQEEWPPWPLSHRRQCS